MLKKRLLTGKVLLAPGVFDGLSALIAEKENAEVLYLSGAALANTRFGRPDIGLVSVTEVADNIGVIRDRVNLPIIVDADNGYGNALNVIRTIRLFERMGANAIQLEDQTLPKRCGHMSGNSLISCNEMVGKIHAACDARLSQETLIIARTDAIGVKGFNCAIDRAEAFIEAGADIIFIEAPKSIKQMKMIIDNLSSKSFLMVNIVEGGKTPLLSLEELGEIGFNLVIFPGGIVRAIASTAVEYYKNLIMTGSNDKHKKNMFNFKELNSLIGTPEILEKGKRYDESSN